MLSMVATIDDVEIVRFAAPQKVLAREPWALGVVAVDLECAAGTRRVSGRVRATVSGRAGRVDATLGPGSLLHVYLEEEREARARPEVELPIAGAGIAGGVALYIDAQPVSATLLDARQLRADPPPRAQAQVYCRWLRSGEIELGCELTDFVSLPPGERAPRLVSRFVDRRSVLTIGVVAGK